jgi:mRNA interferase RelE/StbE
VSQYRIEIRQSAAKEIKAIGTKRDRLRVMDAIGRLAHDSRPPGCRKLSGRSAYRIRVGVYRIVYTVEDDRLVVVVVRVGHRRDVYRG